MSAFVDDFGAAHPQAKQIRVVVTGLPFSPGAMILNPVESGALRRTVDTYDTKDGEPHSAGPSTASQETSWTFYGAQTPERLFMEKWLDLFEGGAGELSKVDIIVDYPTSDGLPGVTYKLTRCGPTGSEDGGSGAAGSHKITFTMRYKRKKITA